MPKLTNNEAPLNPYRVLWDLQKTVDVANTIITHDAGSPRDQLSPFWKTTHAAHLHRLGQDHPARLRARPRHGRQARHARQALHQRVGRRRDRLHRHGFRDGGARAHPDPVDPAQQLLDGDRAARSCRSRPRSTASTDISGDYAAMARAFGGYGERVEKPEDIVAAIKRGIERPRRASRCCSSSSPPRKSTSPGCERGVSSRALCPGSSHRPAPERAARWIPGTSPRDDNRREWELRCVSSVCSLWPTARH